MSKILAVFGATGLQGGALINNLLEDAELSQQFKIRAITRNSESAGALKLKEKVDVVRGDASDPESLKTALAGVHTVFAMTVPTWDSDAQVNFDNEFKSGKDIADAAVAQGAQYIIFSTLPSVVKGSGGRYTKAHHFDSKAAIEDYIRGLPIKSAFVSLGAFMTNFSRLPLYKPHREPGTDTWVMGLPNSPDTKAPLVDVEHDMGKYVGAILAEPDKYEGKTFSAAQVEYTMAEIAVLLSEASGKKVVYQQVLPEVILTKMPVPAEGINQVLAYVEEIGYYGPESDKEMAWTAANTRGKLTTFKEYLQTANYTLE